MKTKALQKLTVSALLIAVGMLIPIFSPVKLILEPASFTLASHVAIFIAILISPGVAAAVAAGTALGFLFSGIFPIVVTLRAASHLIFAAGGAYYLQKRPGTLKSPFKIRLFSFATGVVHALGELTVVSVFYFGGSASALYYDKGFLASVICLVGAGSVIHSMVDFEIAWLIIKALSKQKSFAVLQNSI